MRYLLSLAAACSLSACAYHAPDAPTPVTVPPSTIPATIRVISASRTDGRVDVSAEVLTAGSIGVASVPVVFVTSAGSFSPASATTDTSGVARSILATTDPNDAVTVTAGGISTTVTMFVPQPPTPVPPSLPPPPTSPQPYAVNLSVAPTGTTGVSLLFSVGTGAPSTTVWFWNFGDGQTVQTSTGATAHTYLSPGTYTASVNGAGTATGTASITISNPVVVTPPPPPTPTLAASIGCTPVSHGSGPTQCNVQVTYGGIPVSPSLTAVTWDWGDGQTGAGGTASSVLGQNTYVQPGTYTIVANVTATISGVPQATTVTKTVVIP